MSNGYNTSSNNCRRKKTYSIQIKACFLRAKNKRRKIKNLARPHKAQKSDKREKLPQSHTRKCFRLRGSVSLTFSFFHFTPPLQEFQINSDTTLKTIPLIIPTLQDE